MPHPIIIMPTVKKKLTVSACDLQDLESAFTDGAEKKYFRFFSSQHLTGHPLV